MPPSPKKERLKVYSKKLVDLCLLPEGFQVLRMAGAVPGSPLAIGVPLCNAGKFHQVYNLHACYYAKYVPLVFSHLNDITMQLDSDNINLFPASLTFGSSRNLLAKASLSSPLEEANTMAKYATFKFARTALLGSLDTLKISLYDQLGENLIVDPQGEISVWLHATVKRCENY